MAPSVGGGAELLLRREHSTWGSRDRVERRAWYWLLLVPCLLVFGHVTESPTFARRGPGHPKLEVKVEP